MKLKYFKSALTGSLLAMACLVNAAYAGIIDYGNLTLENASDTYVTDSVSGYDWLRWDQVKTLNYSQLLNSIGVGGEFEGWHIAHNEQMNDFVNALLPGGSDCDSEVITGACTTDLDFTAFSTLMGISYDNLETLSLAWFLTDGDGQNEIGLVQAWDDGLMWKDNDNNSIAYTDGFSDAGLLPPVGFQLYRLSPNTSNVPEPSTLAIFALGMIGLASRRFKKQS